MFSHLQVHLIMVTSHDFHSKCQNEDTKDRTERTTEKISRRLEEADFLLLSNRKFAPACLRCALISFLFKGEEVKLLNNP